MLVSARLATVPAPLLIPMLPPVADAGAYVVWSVPSAVTVSWLPTAGAGVTATLTFSLQAARFGAGAFRAIWSLPARELMTSDGVLRNRKFGPALTATVKS